MRIRYGMMGGGSAPSRGSWLTAMRRAALGFKNTRVLPVTGGILLACLTDSAYALNGNIYVLSCACQTTGDFSAAAIQESNGNGWGGTYLAVSTSTASTSLMQVHGKHLIDKFGNDYWLATSAIPMDDSGNSLAGDSESAQEGYYQTLDLVTFGTDRSNPVFVTDTNFGSSFGTSTDAEVSDYIDSFPFNFIPANGFVTVTFNDHSSAQFVESPPGSKHWVWNGIAHDSAGNLLNRDGSVKSNPNTGGTGGGSVQTTGFGQGSGSRFDISGFGSCLSVTTITVNGEGTNYSYVHPC